jgi:hypothetical protein
MSQAGKAEMVSDCGRTIDEIVAELTNVRNADGRTVFLYGRPKWTGPTRFKSSTVWLLWKPFDAKPGEKMVTLLDGMTKKTREGESPDHLIEIPAAHAMVLDLEDFVLSDAHVERVKRRINEQRSF